jgi:hypothetical protein
LTGIRKAYEGTSLLRNAEWGMRNYDHRPQDNGPRDHSPPTTDECGIDQNVECEIILGAKSREPSGAEPLRGGAREPRSRPTADEYTKVRMYVLNIGMRLENWEPRGEWRGDEEGSLLKGRDLCYGVDSIGRRG